MTVLGLAGITKVYPGPPPVKALAGIDLQIEPGELVAISGPSGSGKSTLLHIMGALDRPSSGSIEFEGLDLSGLSDRRLSGLRAHRIGFVFQDFFLIRGMTAQENVAQGLVYQGVAPSERRRRSREMLDNVGLGHRLGHLPSQLSGGERQRVAIARAMVGGPAVLFADEPTGNLDSATATGIVALFLGLGAAGAAIVVITHNHEVADRFPRRIPIRDGRLEEAA